MKKFIKKIFRNITILILILVIGITTAYLMRVKIIKSLVESNGSISNGALVEVEGLENPLFTLEITMDKLQITDKEDFMKNSYEIRGAEFNLEPKPLLAGKIIIDQLNIGEVLLDTARESSGELPEKIKEKIAKKAEKAKKAESKEDSKLKGEIKNYFGEIVDEKKEEVFTFDDFEKDKVGENFKNELDFKVEKEFAKAEKIVDQKEEYWSKFVDDKDYKGRIKNLEKDFGNIDVDTSHLEKLFKKIKDKKSLNEFKVELKRLESKKSEIKAVVDTGKEIVDDIESDKKKFESDIKELDKLKDNLTEVVEDDLKSLEGLGDLNKDEVEQLLKNLLGEKITNLLIKLTNYYEKATGMFGNKKKTDEEKESKSEKMPELPKFWIKETKVKVFNNDSYFDGVITDITDNQDRTGNPIIIALKNEEGKKITTLDSIIDFRGENNLKKVEIKQNGAELENESLGFADISRSDVTGTSYITMNNDDFAFVLDLELFNIDFKELSKKGDKLADELTKRIVDSIETITLRIGFENDKFTLKTNLRKIFSDKLDEIYKEEMKEAEEKIRKEINEKIEKYRNELLAEVDKLEAEIGTILSDDQKEAVKSFKNASDVEELLKDKLSELDKGQIEKLKQEQEKLKKEIEAKLKAEEEKLRKKAEEKAAAEKAKQEAEAEEKLKKELEKLKDKFKF